MTIEWLRAKLSFEVLRSALLCVRGQRRSWFLKKDTVEISQDFGLSVVEAGLYILWKRVQRGCWWWRWRRMWCVMPRSNFIYFYKLQILLQVQLYVFKFEHDFVLFTELYPRLSALDKSEAPAFTDGYTLGVTYAAILHTINSIMQIHNSVSCISQLGVPHRS